MSFNNLGLSPSLLETLAKINYKKATPIQKAAIPVILSGKDVLGIAKTGSGKTASFVLPILMNLQKDHTALKNRHVKVLVLVPTRELAVQVNEVFQQFANSMERRIKTMAVFGGVSINPQMINLQNVAILTATPGRLLELVASKAVHLSDVKTFVLDEADKMLNQSFAEEFDKILALLPPKRQNLLFSATLNRGVQEIEALLLDNPEVIKIEAQSTDSKTNDIELINQTAYLVEDERKGTFLRYLLKTKEWDRILIFASSSRKVDNLTKKLNKNGIEAMAIHGKKTQGARTRALKQFKAGELRVLVATDLLSRGIDIEFLPCVINYELPRSPKDYIHRIGRTGRAEASGDAIAIVTKDELHHFKIIQKKMGKWIKLTYTEEVDLHGF